METDRQKVEDQAAEFLRKRESGPWTPADEVEFSGWMESTVSHRVAYLRIEAAWESVGRLKALGAGLPDREVPSSAAINEILSIPPERQAEPTSQPETPRTLRRRVYFSMGMAASLVSAGLSLWGYQVWFQGERYSTPVGGLTSVPLGDGSNIILNTDSKVRVVLTETERHVDLAKGEAFFEVAKDAKRPFVVEAAHTRIVAVGTQFSVRRASDSTTLQVVVTEGKVRIEESNPPPVGRVTAAGALATPNVLMAGQMANISVGGVQVRQEPAPAADESLAWRNGYLVFHNTELAEAVAEFNRYSSRHIVIKDASLASMPLTGKFRATNSEAFINLLGQTFHIRVEDTPDEIDLGAENAK